MKRQNDKFSLNKGFLFARHPPVGNFRSACGIKNTTRPRAIMLHELRMHVRSLSLCVFALLLLSPHAAFAASRSYFEMSETFSEDVQHFPKWNGMIGRFTDAQKLSDDRCDRVEYFPCSLRDWRQFIEKERGKGGVPLLERVNDYGNAFPYTIDQINWGVEDYWETPYEFHTVSGDCEDYAITKYYTLRAMGIPADKMRIIIVQDFNLGGVIHAVLGVYNNGQLFLLDNQIKQVISARKVYHYKPVYGINEQGWWAYYPRM
jgi:predicted transglutaminase-like cysteine proteinase